MRVSKGIWDFARPDNLILPTGALANATAIQLIWRNRSDKSGSCAAWSIIPTQCQLVDLAQLPADRQVEDRCLHLEQDSNDKFQGDLHEQQVYKSYWGVTL